MAKHFDHHDDKQISHNTANNINGINKWQALRNPNEQFDHYLEIMNRFCLFTLSEISRYKNIIKTDLENNFTCFIRVNIRLMVYK